MEDPGPRVTAVDVGGDEPVVSARPNRETANGALVEAVCERVRDRVCASDAPQVEEFVRQFYDSVPAEDLADHDPLDLYGAALAHWSFARWRDPGAVKARVYNPSFEQHGWQSTHTVVELVCDDMPFLVDSAGIALNRLAAGVHVLIHPVMRVQRSDAGELAAVLPSAASNQEGPTRESYIHIELDRQSEAAELDALRDELLSVLGQVGAAVKDWPAMRERAADLVIELGDPPAALDPDECAEAAELLRWMLDGNFTFLGFREYDLVVQNGEDCLRIVPDSGLVDPA